MLIKQLERFKRIMNDDLKELERLIEFSERRALELQAKRLDTLLALRDLDKMIENERGKKIL